MNYYSNGKLLLTGEYLVLDGALSLAVPTNFGQSLVVEPINEPKIKWKSFDKDRKTWLEETFEVIEAVFPFTYEFSSFINEKRNLSDEAQLLLKILFTANQLNNSFLGELIDTHKNYSASHKGYKVCTKLDFPIDWGLGTSSTLINNIANWANVNAYELLEKTFGGSGYDIACAQHDQPILYQLVNGSPKVKEVRFQPNFKDQLYFVYLNKKQNSRDAIANYRNNTSDVSQNISEISDITKKMVNCIDLKEFQLLIKTHEQILSKILHQQPIQEKLFSDFDGSVKSLGAWGGDFVMVASEENPRNYFKSKGFDTILTFRELIK